VVVATGSSASRSLANRFADVVNILDFGADPTGTNDSWLAIQRAIAASGNHPEWNPATLTLSDTLLWGNKNIPKLFFNVGTKKVIFPTGTYRVSRPIVVGSNMWLEGQPSVNITPTIGQRGQFNLIEDADAYIFRELDTVDLVPYQLFSGYGHGIKISNLTLLGYHESDPYPVGVTDPKLNFLPMPVFTTGPGSSFSVYATGVSGQSTLTLSGSSANSSSFPPQCKIKIQGHNTVYTVTSTSGATLNITPNLTASFTGQNVLMGIPANNGIFIAAGEAGFIDSVYAHSFQGAGIYLYTGTPSNVIRNCMCNGNDIGYHLDAGTSSLFQPSGDSNNVFIRAGWYSFCGSLTCVGMKVEDGREFDTVFYTVAGSPYPLGNRAREVLELGSRDGAGSACYSFVGGSVNRNIGVYRIRPEAKDTVFISCFRQNIFPHIRVANIKQLGYGEKFMRIYQMSNGNTDCLYKRSHAYDYDGTMEFGTLPTFSWYDNVSHPPMNGIRLLTRNSGNDPQLAQIMVDQGSGFAQGSDGTGTATFTRSGTTATFSLQAHGLQVGDYVGCASYTNTTPANVGLNTDTSGVYPANGYFTGSMRVQTVSDANTFTTTVLNSGATAGSCRVQLFKFAALARYRGRTLEQQMPTNTGPDSDALGFAWLDKRESLVAGLRVATTGNSQMWTTQGFIMGNTPASPNVAILHGTGAQLSANPAAPNGSIFLRTDGDASTTIYVRAGGNWKPMASWEP
jgi:hypothetical protein